MKRLAILLVLFGGALWAQAHGEVAAHSEAGEGHEGSHEAGDPQLLQKWFNFAALAAGLGYLAIKLGGPALKAQQAGILEGMNAAAKRAEAAAARAEQIDEKMACLQGEIGDLREKAKRELEAEALRIQKETQDLLAKVESAAQQEIATAGKSAQQELKATAATLAMDLAQQKLRARMTGEIQGSLVDRFVKSLDASRETRS